MVALHQRKLAISMQRSVGKRPGSTHSAGVSLRRDCHYSTGLRAFVSLPKQPARSIRARLHDLGYSLIRYEAGALRLAGLRRAELSQQIATHRVNFARYGVWASIGTWRPTQCSRSCGATRSRESIRRRGRADRGVLSYRIVAGACEGTPIQIHHQPAPHGSETRHEHRVLYGQGCQRSALAGSR